MNQLTIDTIDQDLSRQTFSQMVQRYGFAQVQVRRIDNPNSSPVYRITVNVDPPQDDDSDLPF
jgi:hypothetical protein